MNGLFGFLMHNWMLSVPLLAVLITLFAIEFRNRNVTGAALPSHHAVQFINQTKSLVVDLRPQEQFNSNHIIKAKNFDEKALKQDLTPLKKNKATPILIVCDNGVQSGNFASWLSKQGFENVKALQGGLRQWSKEGLPTTKESS